MARTARVLSGSAGSEAGKRSWGRTFSSAPRELVSVDAFDLAPGGVGRAGGLTQTSRRRPVDPRSTPRRRRRDRWWRDRLCLGKQVARRRRKAEGRGPCARVSETGREASVSLPGSTATPSGSRNRRDGRFCKSFPGRNSRERDELAVVPNFQRQRRGKGRFGGRKRAARPDAESRLPRSVGCGRGRKCLRDHGKGREFFAAWVGGAVGARASERRFRWGVSGGAVDAGIETVSIPRAPTTAPMDGRRPSGRAESRKSTRRNVLHGENPFRRRGGASDSGSGSGLGDSIGPWD